MNLTEAKTRAGALVAARELALSQRRNERAALRRKKAAEATLREALRIAQQTAQSVQEAAHAKIANIVSHSLAAVFDTPYKFKINFEQKRGRTEANLTFERNGFGVSPMDAAGGGVIDIASFALRLSCLLLANPPRRRLLVLDEPLSMLSAEYRPRARELITRLAKELNVQILIISHAAEFQMGDVIEL